MALPTDMNFAPIEVEHTPRSSKTSEGIHFRPMLSGKLPSSVRDVPTQEQVIADLKRLDWSRGFMASPKLDGIRAVKSPEGLVSRTLKLIPNRFVQACLSHEVYNGLDGELVVGDPNEMVNFNDSQSGIMSQDGEPRFTWCVFDDVLEPHASFRWRYAKATERVLRLREFLDMTHNFDVRIVEHKLVMSIEELLEYEAEQLAKGYEGIMFRDPMGRYKSFPSNRSTFKEQGLIKLKRFVDAEARIVGFEELQRNANEAVRDALGYQKRSAHNAGQVAGGTLGKLLVVGINGRFKDSHFAIGSGLDDTLRGRIWSDRESHLGLVVKYKYQDAGAKDNPRTPIFLGFRPQGA